jgi:hypothetical protein
MYTNKKGYSLIEATLAVSIFSILFLGALTLEAAKIKLKAINKRKEICIMNIEAVKSSIMNDITYEDFKNLYDGGKRYINCSDMSMEKLRNTNIKELLVTRIENEASYIYISISEEKPVKVIVKYFINDSLLHEAIQCEFYKGNYY